MKNSLLKPRAVNLNKCRVLTGNKSCSVSCGGQEEIILIPLNTFNQLLRDKKIDALAAGNFLSSHLTDITSAWQIKKIFDEFGMTGKAYEKTIRGVKYVIFKGKPGLRNLFKGTKYGVGNSKVLSYGVGKAGYARSIKGGTIISLVFVNAWNIAEFFIKHDKSLTDLGVDMASDSVKVVLASVAGGIVGGIAVTLGAPILVPLAAGLVVSVLVGLLLDKIDEEWKITESFRIWVHEVVSDSQPMLNSTKLFMRESLQSAGNAVGGMKKELDGNMSEWKKWFENFSFGH